MTTNAIAAGISKALLIILITSTSAFIFSGAIAISRIIDHVPDYAVDLFYGIAETMIRKMEHLIGRITTYIDAGNWELSFLAELHQYLTPIIRSYELIFHIIQRLIVLSEMAGTHDTSRIEELGDNFREVGNLLMALYRLIENILEIDPQDSPIGQAWYER